MGQDRAALLITENGDLMTMMWPFVARRKEQGGAGRWGHPQYVDKQKKRSVECRKQ